MVRGLKLMAVPLALVALLGACGAVEPVDVSEVTSSTAITTTETENTTADETGHKMSVIERKRHEHGVNDIWLRDEITGKETLLIEGNDDNGEGWYDPYVSEIIDDRFFWYDGNSYEGVTSGGVFDIQRMMQIPVEFPGGNYAVPADVIGGIHYFTDFIYGEECGQLHVYPLKPENLNTATSLIIGENLLKDIPEADMSDTWYYQSLISPDARYFVVAEESAVRVFNLETKEFHARIPVENPGYFRITFRDERTLICNQSQDETNALEITLP